MAMCAACVAMLEGQQRGDGHAGLMSLGRRGYRVFGRSRSAGGEHYVCRICGSEWRRDHGMQPVKRPAFGLPGRISRAAPRIESKR